MPNRKTMLPGVPHPNRAATGHGQSASNECSDLVSRESRCEVVDSGECLSSTGEVDGLRGLRLNTPFVYNLTSHRDKDHHRISRGSNENQFSCRKAGPGIDSGECAQTRHCLL